MGYVSMLLNIIFSQIKVVRVDWLGNLANNKEDYNVSLLHIVCTVTVRIFCSRCDASLVYWLLANKLKDINIKKITR